MPGPHKVDAIVKGNEAFRRVFHTMDPSPYAVQMVAMHLSPGENIGKEIHNDTTQYFAVTEGTGTFIRESRPEHIQEGSKWVVEPGVEHDIQAITDLKLLTIYFPPHHPKGTLQKIK